MNDAPVPHHEFADIQLLVRQSVNEITAALSDQAADTMRYSLGHAASALAITEGPEAAHGFASSTIENLELHPREAFGVWADLYKVGDEKALPKARQAAGLTGGEQAALLEERTATQLGSAACIVELVEAGDTGATEIARDVAKRAWVIERAGLFSKLYKAGDAASLDLAIEAAKAAKHYTKQIGSGQYFHSERALVSMADFAAQNGKLDDALKLVDYIESAASKASLHAKLFRHGRDESLQFALDYLGQPASNSSDPMRVERRLAEAGYAPAIQNIKQRTASGKRPSHISIVSFLDDLTTLHNAGDETAAAMLAEAVRSDRAPEYYFGYLGRVGLVNIQTEMATDLYNRDPSGENAGRILDAQHNNATWKEVFNYWLHGRNDVLQASSLVRALASRLQTGQE